MMPPWCFGGRREEDKPVDSRNCGAEKRGRLKRVVFLLDIVYVYTRRAASGRIIEPPLVGIRGDGSPATSQSRNEKHDTSPRT